MVAADLPTVGGLHLLGLHQLRKNWGWFLGLGVALVILGTVALGASVFVTMATMVFVGYLMLIGGILEMIHAFANKAWGGFFVDLLFGVLSIVAGFLIVVNPLATGVVLTLLIAMFLVFGGISRIAIALAVRFPNWGWLLLHGAIDLVLGIMIWQKWPASGLWVLGLFVSIDMIMNGWSLIMLGLAAKSLPDHANASATPAHAS